MLDKEDIEEEIRDLKAWSNEGEEIDIPEEFDEFF